MITKKKTQNQKVEKKMKTRLFKCGKCEMTFTSKIRLQRHYTKAHPPKKEHYKQKWYWEN